jgi:oxygen-independent coproporphyrinogen-3 oxidase
MYLVTMERLEEEGYEQYEISNAAKRGRRSRHNMKYWDGGEWHGFGPGAHSTRAGARWNNVAGTAEYIARVRGGASAAQGVRRLDARERLEEALFMGLRLAEGVSLRLVRERFGVDAWSIWGNKLSPAVEAGLLVHADDTLRLTRQGMLVANDVMATFLEADCTVK